MFIDFKKITLYEDNHLLVVSKPAGLLTQPDSSEDPALEEMLKSYIKRRDEKPGNVYLGVVHRIDRPVSGVVIFAKTSKALVRLNQMVKDRNIKKIYWAIVANPKVEVAASAELKHHIERSSKKNRSFAYDRPTPTSKEGILNYRTLARGDKYRLLEVDLQTGRHHQIRCQLSRVGLPIKGDLKYGAVRENSDTSISLHARSVTFAHPVTKEKLTITAPTPAIDRTWSIFENRL